jgi:hypothetical protein
MAHIFLISSAECFPDHVALHWDDHQTQPFDLSYHELLLWAQSLSARLTERFGAGLLRGSVPDREIGKALVALAIEEVGIFSLLSGTTTRSKFKMTKIISGAFSLFTTHTIQGPLLCVGVAAIWLAGAAVVPIDASEVLCFDSHNSTASPEKMMNLTYAP